MVSELNEGRVACDQDDEIKTIQCIIYWLYIK